MKACVKATGDIVEVAECSSRYKERGWDFVSIATRVLYTYADLDFDVNNKYPDYWTRLEHQYAGMAMQGILSNPEVNLDYNSDESMPHAVAATAYNIAHALIQKLKSSDL